MMEASVAKNLSSICMYDSSYQMPPNSGLVVTRFMLRCTASGSCFAMCNSVKHGVSKANAGLYKYLGKYLFGRRQLSHVAHLRPRGGSLMLR